MILQCVLIGHEVIGLNTIFFGIFRRGDFFFQYLAFVFCAGQFRAHELAEAVTIRQGVAASQAGGLAEHGTDAVKGGAGPFRQIVQRESGHGQQLIVFTEYEAGRSLRIKAVLMDFLQGGSQ